MIFTVRWLGTIPKAFHRGWGALRRRLRPQRRPEEHVRELDERLVSSLSPRRIPTLTQLKLLPRILSRREQLLTGFLALVFLVSSVWLVLRLIGRFTKPVPIAGGTYVEGTVGQPQYLNPVFASGNDTDDDFIKLLFAGLFRFDPQHFVVPNLAESFTVSPDEKTYTVVLKPNLVWSDGEPLTVDDVLFTFGLIQDPAMKSPLYGSFRTVTVERVDDRTLKFTLEKPLAPFLSSLSVGILPEHRWRDVQPNTARLNKLNLEPIGAGPYRIAEIRYDAGGNIRFTRFEPNPYWSGTAPRIADLNFRFFADPESALAGLKQGKVDGLSYITSDEKAAVDAVGTRILPLRLPQYTALFLNLKRSDLGTAKVREALALALDRPAITREATNGTASVIHGPLPQGFLGSTPAESPHPFDAARAAALLDEAGWKKSEDGVRRQGKDELKLVLTTSDRTDYAKAAGLIEQAWDALGINTTVDLVPAVKMQREIIRPRNYDVILFGQIIGADPDPFPFWHSSQERDPGLNLAIFFNKEIDKLLEDARGTTNLTDRTTKYAEFQNRLNQIIPAIFLYQPSYLYVLPKKVKGFAQESLVEPSDRFSDITNWYMNTRRRFR